MALTKRVVADDSITITSEKFLEIREAIIIEDDGNIISKTFHRYVLEPGADLTGKNESIIAIANQVWTQEVIENYILSKEV